MKWSAEDWTLTLWDHGDRGGLFIEIHEDWSSLFQKCNWYDFTFIYFYVERDSHLNGWETIVALLGLHVRVRLNGKATPFLKEIQRRRDEVLARGGEEP